MRKTITFSVILIMTTVVVSAQKFAFVDSEYILQNIPSYEAAQDEIDKASQDWEEEVKKEYEAIEEMYKTYKSERVLLTEEMRQKREETILAKEKEVKELQQQYFGPEGELFKLREELVQPIQDAIYKSVKELTAEGGYAIIFDTASGAAILYSNPKFDKSDEILERMGYK